MNLFLLLLFLFLSLQLQSPPDRRTQTGSFDKKRLKKNMSSSFSLLVLILHTSHSLKYQKFCEICETEGDKKMDYYFHALSILQIPPPHLFHHLDFVAASFLAHSDAKKKKKETQLGFFFFFFLLYCR